MPVLKSYGLAETKDNFSAYTSRANETGLPFIVVKQNKPWVKIVPLRSPGESKSVIKPVEKRVVVADLDVLFSEKQSDYTPVEDGFAAPRGGEAL